MAPDGNGSEFIAEQGASYSRMLQAAETAPCVLHEAFSRFVLERRRAVEAHTLATLRMGQGKHAGMQAEPVMRIKGLLMRIQSVA
ncbi:hypothetical protein PSEUDO9AG_41333 [Pseudomonas sp. 9Ag]|nr:hypothetical protein PSEUDO9AG_41333 [Pseudomonas sp. 9Ag]